MQLRKESISKRNVMSTRYGDMLTNHMTKILKPLFLSYCNKQILYRFIHCNHGSTGNLVQQGLVPCASHFHMTAKIMSEAWVSGSVHVLPWPWQPQCGSSHLPPEHSDRPRAMTFMASSLLVQPPFDCLQYAPWRGCQLLGDAPVAW